jgi:flagellar M-ring protein FliF
MRTVMIGALAFGLIGCEETVIHQLNEREANQVITHLADVSIVSRKVRQADGTWAIQVDEADHIGALKALSAARMLRNVEPREERGNSLLVGREEQRFRHERALSAEIERTLSSVPLVLESRVHLNLPAVDPLFGQRLERTQGSASVLLLSRGEGIDPKQIAAVVSGASGIPAESVAVMIQRQEAIGITDPEQAVVPGIEGPALGRTLSESSATDRASSAHTQANFLRSNRGIIGQIAISLMILGVGLALFLRRGSRHRTEPTALVG